MVQCTVVFDPANYFLVMVFDPVITTHGNSSHKNFRYISFNLELEKDDTADIYGQLKVSQLQSFSRCVSFTKLFRGSVL